MIGKTLGKKYRLVRILGEGGMGSVYEAERKDTPQRVAVKIIHEHLLKPGGDGARRFRREARAASAIASDHIVQVLDSGTDEGTGRLYLVMELLHGEDLQQLCDRVGPIAPEGALCVAAQALVGLQKAHERHIVHRDIKPANIFLARSRDGAITVKLLDFGIAKIKPDPHQLPPTTALTTTGGFLGSPLYMSPEQVESSRDVDYRTDLWSLGSALYCALAGRAPHQHLASVVQLLIAICTSPPQPLSDVASWVPPAVAKVVHGALALKPDERYPNAAAMLGAIRTLLPRGFTLREEMLAPASRMAHAGPIVARIVVDPGATSPVRGDETTAPASPPLPPAARKGPEKQAGARRITVDPRPLLGAGYEELTFSLDADQDLFGFLTRVWGTLRDAGATIPPLSYGKTWILFEPRTGQTINQGSVAEQRAMDLKACVRPGSEFWVMSPASAARGARRRALTEKRYRIGHGEVMLTVGDICHESTDAIVNATDGLLSGAGGVDRAIHRAAGVELRAACDEITKKLPGGRLAAGRAVVTPGFRLSARHVIHCVGPIYTNDPAAARVALGDCFRNALRLCRELELRTIAFPAISTGARGYPMADAAMVALTAIETDLLAHTLPEQVRVVLFDEDAFGFFASIAQKVFS